MRKEKMSYEEFVDFFRKTKHEDKSEEYSRDDVEKELSKFAGKKLSGINRKEVMYSVLFRLGKSHGSKS